MAGLAGIQKYTMKHHPIPPEVAMHVCRRIQRERVTFRNSAMLPFLIIFTALFWLGILIWLLA